MSKVVYKYPLLDGNGVTSIPEGDILHIGIDPQGILCAWALVDPESKELGRVIHLISTGHTIHNDRAEKMEYVTTVKEGPFMWHIFTEDISTTEQR